MSKLFPTLILLVLLAGACRGSDDSVPEVTDVQVTFAINPEPAAVGESTVMVTLAEADGAPIAGATVHIRADMDHAGMVPVEAETSTSDGGAYHIPLTWTMGGGWIVEVRATLPDDRGIAVESFEVFVEAISRDSIINQGAEATDEAHEMDDMDTPESTEESD